MQNENNKTSVEVFSKTFQNFNILSVSAGTNCPQGGDSGHGGRTVFRLLDEGGTDIRVRTDMTNYEHVQFVEIVLGGDAEAITFLESLEFAADTIRHQLGFKKAVKLESFE